MSSGDAVRRAAVPLDGGASDLDPLLDLVGDARFVLLGEASHGTSDFYAERARLTARLIDERGFSAVAVEADWPDAHRAGRYATGASDDTSAEEALRGFRRFPTWMWRNTDVVAFLEWLRARNAARPPDTPAAGFYGLDLYSLGASMEAVIRYLESVDPEAAERARRRYGCLMTSAGDDSDGQAYGADVAFGAGESCEAAVVAQLVELCQKAVDADDFFDAEQNARVVRDAEAYYRQMYTGRASTWNLRDTHMADTLDDVALHLSRRQGAPAKVVVWEHNSHVGDARATELGRGGELTVGQLVRERHHDDAVLVGLTTATGTVIAADDWGGPPQRKRVRPPLPGSYEERLSATGLGRFVLPLHDDDVADALEGPLLERAIGVIYRPQTERTSHWFRARLPEQFDAVVHLDETRAVAPLDPFPTLDDGGEPPETYPFGV